MRKRHPDSLVPVLEALRVRSGHLSEAEAAELMGVSTTWFRHYFKDCTNTSFRRARVSAKLAHGAALLAGGSSIPEITAALGYSDRSKFEKAFKRLYAVTPTQYRQQFRPETPHFTER